MNKEQLIATLQACFFGDKGAYNLILEKYQELEQENNQLKENNLAMQEEMSRTWGKLNIIKELRSWLEDKIHNIVPEGCGINYNCEYDSEEDYVRAMEERSSLHTLKDTLDKLNELEGGKNE